MKSGISSARWLLVAAAVFSLSTAAIADTKQDPFKGKLFAPNVILENQDALGLSKEQFTAIRAAVVEVQSRVAGYEWDLRQAYVALLAELDKKPVDEDSVLKHVSTALLAENEVKKNQVAMLVRLKNLLTDEQIAYLESMHGQ